MLPLADMLTCAATDHHNEVYVCKRIDVSSFMIIQAIRSALCTDADEAHLAMLVKHIAVSFLQTSLTVVAFVDPHLKAKTDLTTHARWGDAVSHTSFATQAALFLMFCSSSFRRVRSLPSTSRLDLLTSLAYLLAWAIFQRRSLSAVHSAIPVNEDLQQHSFPRARCHTCQ